VSEPQQSIGYDAENVGVAGLYTACHPKQSTFSRATTTDFAVM